MQLKIEAIIEEESIKYIFQFQSGAVKRKNKTGYTPQQEKFQFQSGAVKSSKQDEEQRKTTYISIPKWCG